MRLGSILDFEYPVTKPFPVKWRYGLLAFTLLSSVVLVTINVFLVGYDVVSITTADFTSAQKSLLPWASSTTFGCQPHQFQLGDTFRTNISAFSYSIFDVELNDTGTSASLQGGFLYRNEDLSSCDVVQYEIEVKPGDRLITPSAAIKCPPPLGFQAVTSWSIFRCPVIPTIRSSVASLPLHFAEKSLGRAITDGMRNISSEAYWDIYNMSYTTTTQPPEMIYKVLAEGQPTCDPDPPFYCHIPDFSMYNAIGATDLSVRDNNISIQAHVANLVNVVTVLYAAVRLDLGHWTADNLFTNATSFNNSILPFDISQPNLAIGGVSFLESSKAFRSVASSTGMAYVNFTDPPSASDRTAAAAIQIPYICNVMRMKPIGSFIVSVLSATVSMFLAAWGTLLAILSRIARKRPGANTYTPPPESDIITVWDESDTKSAPLLHSR
ncbi:hypothetical protein MSAN_02302900 [Mycena sanguinolenta]|uniref:Uncharacterized protein n=1 Tax=Mycena sanguinolenta TaxID=230812 RepID=A0A8H6X8N1_9AGAR|nr:hypothetical protein MSAN_02302900 [Mycena sanguinolenta]